MFPTRAHNLVRIQVPAGWRLPLRPNLRIDRGSLHGYGAKSPGASGWTQARDMNLSAALMRPRLNADIPRSWRTAASAWPSAASCLRACISAPSSTRRSGLITALPPLWSSRGPKTVGATKFIARCETVQQTTYLPLLRLRSRGAPTTKIFYASYSDLLR
jgi:hypothetical protein